MTFRISKYSHNSWKKASPEKNYVLIYKYRSHVTIFGFIYYILALANLKLGFIFYKSVINDNNLTSEMVNIFRIFLV